MIALIKNNGREYHSPVLAIYSNGWKSKVLVFNNDKSNIVFQSYWVGRGSKKIRSVYILSSSKMGWTTIDKYSGIEKIINNPDYFKRLRKGKDLDDLIQIAKLELEKMVIQEWMPIENETDVESFNDLTFGLHDAIILSIEDNEEFTAVHYDTTWSCQILMKFYGVQKSNLTDSGPNYCSSYINFNSDMIIFKADLCWDDGITESPELICYKIEYKLLETE